MDTPKEPLPLPASDCSRSLEVICEDCDGSGWSDDPTPTPCPHCVEGRVPGTRRKSCNLCKYVGRKGDYIRCDHPSIKGCEEADGISEDFAEECQDYEKSENAKLCDESPRQ